MHSRILLMIALSYLCGLHLAHSAPPQGATGQFSEWFQEQRQIDNLPARCCGGPEEEGGDGRYVFVRHEMGKWLVWVKEIEEWIPYPRAVDPDIPNPTGRNVAWYIFQEDESITWYCLRISIGI